MDIKDILISIREKNGYTKKEVADRADIPYTTYIKYESGERKDVSMQALCKLADFYGVTTDYLLGREERPNPFAFLNVALDEDEFINIYKQLPQVEKEILADAISKLAEANRQRKKQ